MVIVYIGGGLANKMFQYALSLAIQKKGFNVKYDVKTFVSEFIHENISLDSIFPNIKLDTTNIIPYCAAGKNNKFFRLVKWLMPQYIIEKKYKYNKHIFNQLRKNCYVESSWQNEKYFIDVKEEVIEAFRFPQLIGEKNKDIMNMMKGTNSIAIHLRKGDGYGKWNIYQNTCTKQYYQEAIKYIEKKIKNPHYYIFTDNSQIIDEYFDFIDNYTLINWNPTNGYGNHIDMQLMSYAKHNIIANSTYSWWGAWLNSNPNKIVIAPRFWYNPKSKLANINHIIPNNWIKL